MKKLMVAAVVALLGAGAFADSTDASWQYVSPIPDDWKAAADKGNYNSFDATGVITNGDWKLFVKKSGTSLSLSSYSGVNEYILGGAYLSGAGLLDLSKPIYVEGTSDRLYVTVMPIHNFSGVTAITEFIAPPELTTVKGYNFYVKNGVKPTGLTNAVFNCPGLTYIGDGVFRFCPNLTRIAIRSDALQNIASASDVGTFAYMEKALEFVEIVTTNSFKYGPGAFSGDRMSKLSADRFSFDRVTSVGKVAFMAAKGSGMTGDVNFASLTTVGEQAFRFQNFSKVILGYDALNSVGKEAFYQCDRIQLFVVGAGDVPLVLKKDLFSHASGSGPDYRVFFRGDAPDASQLESGTYAFYDDRGDRHGRFYIPYGNASWNAVIAQVSPCSQEEFNRDYPDDDAQVIGLLPPRLIGNFGWQYLCYGDYRAEESDLIVAGEPGAYGAVGPAYGRHWQYAAGDTIPLTAPEEALEVGGMRLKATRYVVETIDRFGRWTNPVTNDYEKGVSSVTLPGSGASLRVTWLFDVQHRVSLAPLMSADYPEEVTCDCELDAEGCAYISEGATVTFTARAESPELPKTRFVRWEGDIGDADPTNNVLTLSVDAAKRVKAVFSHGWRKSSSDRITDGIWTLRVTELSALDGQKRLCVGDNYESWSPAWVSYGGSLGALDLSSRIEDDSGNDWFITKISTCSLRGDTGYSTNIGGAKVLKDLTVASALTTVGSHAFFGHTALTNAVIDCPGLKTLSKGFLYDCTALRRVYLKADSLTSVGGNAEDYVPFRLCNNIHEFYIYAPNLKEIPPYFAATSLKLTDVTDWRLDSVTNVADYAFDNSSIWSGGPTGTLHLPSLVMLKGAKQFHSWTRLSGLRLGSGGLVNLGTEANSTAQMTGLRRIELGLAHENSLHDQLFANSTQITNVTFTAAPPSSATFLRALGGRQTIPTDGTKNATVVVPASNSAWTDEATAQAGVDLAFTADEVAARKALSREMRREVTGVAADTARFAWFVRAGLKNGLMLLFR